MWTEAELDAFRLYSGRGYRKINDFLRGKDDTNAAIRETILVLDKALSRAIVSDDFVAFRGVDGDAAAYIRRMDLQVGDGFCDPGFASASITPARARLFAAWPPGGLLLKIHIKSGMRAVDMSPFSHYPDESEVLLPRDTEFRVIALENADGVLEVEGLHG